LNLAQRRCGAAPKMRRQRKDHCHGMPQSASPSATDNVAA